MHKHYTLAISIAVTLAPASKQVSEGMDAGEHFDVVFALKQRGRFSFSETIKQSQPLSKLWQVHHSMHTHARNIKTEVTAFRNKT